MTGRELLEKLIDSYRSSFDVERSYDINGHQYEAYASFNVSSAKYVLMKKAELWRADCYEHTLFSYKEELTVEDLERLKCDMVEYIEPKIVRGGEKCTKKDHMYTYMTGIFIVEEGISDDVKKKIRTFKFLKNYLLGLRGYCEARLLVFDMKNKKVYGNPAARDLVKGYKKTF